ncbi:MAG: GntR family transcriptional regulator [Clostridia bacterium]|nr:GntR family transcriptional regulator [Clostridia bacterium]
MAKRENAPTLYIYVKEYIMKLIISGNYPAHSQLPTEYELMETLDVGRATVRAALAQLENEGTIYKRQGVGTFVSERSKHYGLEPLLSLNFMLKHVGMQNNNEIAENGDFIVPADGFLDRWEPGKKVHRLVRIRKSENTVLGYEDNYYLPEIFEKLDENTLSESLAHNLLTNVENPICKFEQTVLVRDPSEKELALFEIDSTEKVVELQRWMYFEGIPGAANFVSFVIPSHILEFPFLG